MGGRTGRAPKPESLRAIEGYRDKCPPRKEPRPSSGKRPPQCPPTLTDDRQRNLWRRLAKDLHAVGLLARVDCAVLETYVRASVEVENLLPLIADQGRTVESAHGATRTNPLVSQLRAAEALKLKCAMQLGMTALSRARLGVAGAKKDTGDAGFQPRSKAG